MEKVLDASKPQKVSYCIPTWLRDEQIKLASARIKDRIEANHDLIQEPIAVVGFGPSLRDTWEEIKKFKYVISCSGSHKFLIERGIIPTWHVEVDPRAHKIELIGPPNKDVTYLIASTCCPKLFDHLEGYNVKLWHVFDNSEEARRTLPRGEWAITGGCDVGLRSVTIARFLGFTDLHIFGMDGSSPGAERHAAEHPNKVQSVCTVEYEGRTFNTTPPMLEAARGMWHELDLLSDVKTTFYGDGLIQHMAKFYKKPEGVNATIAFIPPKLISAEMKDLNARLHQDKPEYGVGGGKHAPVVLKLSEALKTTSILDYGCGKGYLGKALPFPIWEYDPAISEKSELPRPADIVVCTDVLEHIELDRLPFVLEDLQRCVKKAGYFIIHTGPAVKHYANGKNTHLIQKGQDWWEPKLKEFFEIGRIIQKGPELYVVVGPKASKSS